MVNLSKSPSRATAPCKHLTMETNYLNADRYDLVERNKLVTGKRKREIQEGSLYEGSIGWDPEYMEGMAFHRGKETWQNVSMNMVAS